MVEDIKTDTDFSGPINLDSEQLRKLDTLIQNLKKEIIVPGKKTVDKPVASELGHG